MAAEPLLASALLGDEELDALFGDDGKRRDEDEIRVCTGVDGSGIVRGGVVGVWGDGGELVRKMLVDSLIKQPGSTAAVVDTMGNFDVVGVYTGILERLKRDETAMGKVGDGEKVEDVAAKILDCVKIMRVFDFVGVREAIAEIRDDLEGRKVGVRSPKSRTPERVKSPKRPTPEPLTPEPLPKRTVVADSEDEDDDDEMLFDAASPPKPEKAAPAVQEPSLNQQLQASAIEIMSESIPQQEEPPGKVTFILIDNLAHVLNPSLKKDYVQGNTLASTFLQTLNHLTRTHTLYTILANPTTTLQSTSPTRQLPNQPPQENKQQPPPPPSIFTSNSVVPSLVGVLARYVDVGLLVSQMPKRKMDAKVYYRDGNGNGNGNGRGSKKLRGVEMVDVVEVVWDRWEGRGGEWGVL